METAVPTSVGSSASTTSGVYDKSSRVTQLMERMALLQQLVDEGNLLLFFVFVYGCCQKIYDWLVSDKFLHESVLLFLLLL